MAWNGQPPFLNHNVIDHLLLIAAWHAHHEWVWCDASSRHTIPRVFAVRLWDLIGYGRGARPLELSMAMAAANATLAVA